MLRILLERRSKKSAFSIWKNDDMIMVLVVQSQQSSEGMAAT
jgi:hypothetical protein